MIRRLVMPAVLGLVLLPTGGLAFSALDYCRAVYNVERARCAVVQAADVLDCLESYADDRNLGTGSELADLKACRKDAVDTRAECRALLVPCGGEPHGR